MRFTVESIEDGIARLENGTNEAVFVNSSLLPEDTKEGDVLCFDGEKYTHDTEATAERRKAVYNKFNRLFNNK